MAQSQRFTGTARAIVTTSNGDKAYLYHNTAVVTVAKASGNITLSCGGWQTVTTKRAMNQASNQDCLGFSVFQKAGEWFVTWKGEKLPYVRGMVLTP